MAHEYFVSVIKYLLSQLQTVTLSSLRYFLINVLLKNLADILLSISTSVLNRLCQL